MLDPDYIAARLAAAGIPVLGVVPASPCLDAEITITPTISVQVGSGAIYMEVQEDISTDSDPFALRNCGVRCGSVDSMLQSVAADLREILGS